MTRIDKSAKRLVLQSGSTTLTFDRDAGTATFARKVLMFSKKPIEVNLAEVKDASVDAGVDRASGVEICNTMVILKSGAGWAMPAADKKEAEKAAQAIRDFLK
jgi:hypothetical protein